ncbi:MAG: hypothetical protein ACP5UJ_08120 [Athalassotoga sp.]|uniref:hypothetical protein n=1 Tax=Athalassotoga sp. TaxID=2022597 RepID=UPI003D070ABF
MWIHVPDRRLSGHIGKDKKAAESLTKFMDMQKTSEIKIQKTVEEINLLYVAITRAREKIDLKEVKTICSFRER